MYRLLSAGVIHADVNDQNVLVRRDADTAAVTITGLIDFGDAHCAPYVFDVAIAVTYCMLQVKVKVKFSHTCYRALGPELIPVYRQSVRR